jgi:hypothetical protein
MKSKDIEAFIRRSIKANTITPDVAELRSLLDQMSTDEMQHFWMHFAAGRAFSTATTSVPDWKTKEQMACLQHEHLSWMFIPKEKDAAGKYIIVRADLEQHIQTHLLKHIEHERRLEQAFRMRPLFDRLHARVGMAVVVLLWLAIPLGICLFVLSIIFHFTIPNTVFSAAEIGFAVLFGLYVFIMPVVRAILRACKLWRDNPDDA